MNTSSDPTIENKVTYSAQCCNCNTYQKMLFWFEYVCHTYAGMKINFFSHMHSELVQWKWLLLCANKISHSILFPIQISHCTFSFFCSCFRHSLFSFYFLNHDQPSSQSSSCQETKIHIKYHIHLAIVTLFYAMLFIILILHWIFSPWASVS